MNVNDYLLFNQTIQSLRRVGRRGGKATARNRRARQQAMMTPAASLGNPLSAPVESTAEAIARLDAQFPWLRNAERRCDPRNAEMISWSRTSAGASSEVRQ